MPFLLLHYVEKGIIKWEKEGWGDDKVGEKYGTSNSLLMKK